MNKAAIKAQHIDHFRSLSDNELDKVRDFLSRPKDFSKADEATILEYSLYIEALHEFELSRGVEKLYPSKGALRRELYIPHMKFFKAGYLYPIRAVLAGNRIGKSYGIGGCEVVYHATGNYPDWWEGKKFKNPVTIWACGKTAQKTRDVNQKILLGDFNAIGTGLIPKADIGDFNKKSSGNIRDCIGDVYIKHISGGLSKIVFKSYSEERQSFEGEEVHLVWMDEEPPLPIYNECLLRTMTVNGHIICTFTPLDGMSETVLQFLPNGKLPSDGNGLVIKNKFVIMATWDDAPHLTEQQKNMMWDEIPAYQRDARSKGIPQLGSGAIYPIQEQDITYADFEIPVWYPKIYGLDVGWKNTAAVWGAIDPQSDVLYIYSAYKSSEQKPIIHAEAINARGWWIPGFIDPAAAGSSQNDGKRLLYEYEDIGLNINPAINAVEAGLIKVFNRLSTGRMKIFKSLIPWFEEFRLYRRNDKGRIVKEHDHLMDATRYLVMMLEQAMIEPPDEEQTWDIQPNIVCSATGY